MLCQIKRGFAGGTESGWASDSWLSLREPVSGVYPCPSSGACVCHGGGVRGSGDLPEFPTPIPGSSWSGPQRCPGGGHLHHGTAQPGTPGQTCPCMPRRWHCFSRRVHRVCHLHFLEVTSLISGLGTCCSLIPAVRIVFLHPWPTPPTLRKGIGCVASSRKTSLMPRVG